MFSSTPRCISGHECPFTLFCATCGGMVVYRDLVAGLTELPRAEVKLEGTSGLLVGVSPFAGEGAFFCSLDADVKEERTVDRLRLKQISGGAWLDYCRADRGLIDSWLRANSFFRSVHKMVVLDLAHPLSVLTVLSLPLDQSLVVVGLAAGEGSTPMEQNTSHVALEASMRRKLPIVVASRDEVAKMSYFLGREGLVTGFAAFEKPLESMLEAMPAMQDALYGDARLGVVVHRLMVLASASDAVYRSPSEAARALKALTESQGVANASSVLMIGSAARGRSGEMKSAIDVFLQGMDEVVASKRVTLSRRDVEEVYDLMAVLGTEEWSSKDAAWMGYESIANKSWELSVEGLVALL